MHFSGVSIVGWESFFAEGTDYEVIGNMPMFYFFAYIFIKE